MQSEVMSDLASQVRFASRAALLKQIDNAEALAGEIDPDRAYPEDWLVFRVTGFSPEIAAPRLINGASLMRDLSALVERLCSAANISDGDDAARGISVEALCTRWGVTRRTLERFRREGLVARRVRSEAARGRARLVFSDAAVSVFESRHERPSAATPPRAPAGTKRMSAAEKQACLEWAARFHARAACSMNELAVRLARRTGRAKSGMRRLLERDAVLPAARIPAPDGVLGPRERALALRAVLAGASLSRIGRRVGRTPGGVSRAIDVARLDALIALDITPNADVRGTEPRFQDIRTELEAAPLARHDDAWWFGDESFAANDVRSCGADAALNPREELVIVGAYAALRRFAAHAVARSDRTRPDPRLIDEAETALRWASRLKRRLLRATVPLILRTISERKGIDRATASPGSDAAVFRSLIAASAAIDAFVPARGGRLAAPVSLALARALGGHPRGGSLPPKTSKALCAALIPWDRQISMPARVRRGAAWLPASDAAPLLGRFGTPDETPMTLTEIRSRFGVSGAAWWALYRRAIRRAARHDRSESVRPPPPADR